MAQAVLSNAPYEKEWATIDSLLGQGLPQSAQEQLGEFNQQVIADMQKDNALFPHQIKVALYELTINAQLEEQGDWKSIWALEAKMKTAQAPLKAIYESLLAEKYQQYYQRNRWQIGQRTSLEDTTPSEDETTWTASAFLERIAALYLSSLEDKSLRNTTLEQLSPLVQAGVNGDELRPSVYDLLLHRALDYFNYNDAFIGQPSYESNLDDLALLGADTDFIKLDLATAEKSTNTRHVLQIFQEALRWSLNSRPNSLAQVDLDLRRLQFVYDYLQADGKHDAYEQVLLQLAAAYKGQEGEAMVLAKHMEFHRQRGHSFGQADPSTADLQWSFKKAHEVARDIRKRFPKTHAARQAANVVFDLETPSMKVQVEKVQLPETDGLIAITYKQVEDVYLKVIPLSVGEYNERNSHISKLKKLLTRKGVQAWQEQLPQVGDFREHTVESAHKGLAQGAYLLAVSSTENYSLETGATTYFYFWVSDLALLDKSNYSSRLQQFMVVSRSSGQPLAGVTANFWKMVNNGGQVERKLSETLTSDENGMIFPQQEERRGRQVELELDDDRLWVTRSFSSSRYYDKPEPQPFAHTFLDRGIYRPGQEIYFKILALKTEDKIPAVLPNTKVKVGLYDVNGQEVESINLITSRLGSIDGSFTLPSGGLLGNMTIRTDLGYGASQQFRVEEYKRPRFEVKLDSLQEAVQLGDEVVIRGHAKAYAGPAIADAEVVYTVKRGTFFPWAFRGYGRYFPPSQNQQTTIQSGTVVTDENGDFELRFQAMPDANLGSDQLPRYQFTIQADVVDGTGETRSANKTINLAKHPIKFDVAIKEDFSKSEGLAIGITCTNLDGKEVNQTLQLQIEQLDAPEQTFIKRYWERPEKQLLTEREFRQRFPLFSFSSADEKEGWAPKALLWQETIQTSEVKDINLMIGDWPIGHYRLKVLYLTADGDTLSKVKYLRLHDWDKGAFAAGQWLYEQSPKTTAQPGEELQMSYGTQDAPLHLFVERKNVKGTESGRWLNTNENNHYLTGVTENDRGGIALRTTYVLHNRFYENYHKWEIPWSNKELSFTYESFRSKLYPDAEEEWIIRIDGPDKEKVAAEMLAGMYDQSLDQISPFQWNFSPFPTAIENVVWRANDFGAFQNWAQFRGRAKTSTGFGFSYPGLLALNQYNYRNPYPSSLGGGGRGNTRNREAIGHLPRSAAPPQVYAAKASGQHDINPEAVYDSAEVAESEAVGYAVVSNEANNQSANDNSGPPPTKVRTNLSETAFFLPQLMTDEDGKIVVKFRAPESLTRWKLQLLAHTQDLAFALEEQEVVTQKELMILPNAPRFLREGDQMTLTAKVSNLSDKTLAGTATLELFELDSGESLGSAYQLTNASTPFELATDASQTVSWKITVPADATGILGYRMVARSGNYADGEEAAIPILTNRVLLTTAQPLFVRAGKSKDFEISALREAKPESMHQSFRLDITSNPSWEAIKALPYLQEYPYDCTEQLVNRYFANALARTVVERYPAIEEVFASWKEDEDALKSPLLTNQDLKSAVIEETPWVMDAKDESVQRAQIAVLFDETRLKNELAGIERKIQDRQSASGGFSWFPGGRENWYITQYVVEQLSHLQSLQEAPVSNVLQQSGAKAIQFCDSKALEYYEKLKKRDNGLGDYAPSSLVIHYLYMRSLNPSIVLTNEYVEMNKYWWAQAEKHWLEMSLFNQALIALAAKNNLRPDLAQRIYASLRERSLHSDELGRYWKYNNGFYWYQLPIETHVKLMELYQAMNAPDEELAELKIWLLRNKETNRWETTKATAAAIHALMSTGGDWLGETTPLKVNFPDLPAKMYIDKLAHAQANAEAGTGSYEVRWNAEEVKAEMGIVRLKNSSEVPGWGALYWQRFATIDEVERDSDNPLKIERQLYRKTNEGEGDILEALTDAPEQGDLISVRLVIRTDRDMEFVHLKDLRASGLEPIDQLSGYRYQSALGYYRQTTDLGTHFFLDYLPKGEYVLEYNLRVFHAGDFSGGLSSLQCMYAPKFVSHSEGRRLSTKERK